MDFSHILPDNFFQLFQSKHRDLYIEALIRIYDKYESASILGMNKVDAVDVTRELLEERAEKLDNFEAEEDDFASYNDLANHFLRRFEKCGWIYIDVTNDYIELLNFFDYSISMIVAFKEMKVQSSYSLFSDNYGEYDITGSQAVEMPEQTFKGYIYTIYSLLENSTDGDYGLLLGQVYKNTTAFVREIRKVDSRVKMYIQEIVEKEEIKDIIELLAAYKEEFIDRAYFKLKTYDNINKYRLSIVKKLEEMQESSTVMNMIANDYLLLSNFDYSQALLRANKQINDCIDIFNTLDQMIDEIDNKNRMYISQTIAKIKYLLNEDVDVLGQLTGILRYYTEGVQRGKESSSYDKISKLFDLNTVKALNQKSLTIIRGTYDRSDQNKLIIDTFDIESLSKEFFNSFSQLYTEREITNFLDDEIDPGQTVTANNFIKYDATFDDILKLLYIVVYASGSDEFIVRPLNEYVDSEKFEVKNFTITRRS